MQPRHSPFSACTFITPGQDLEKGLSDVRKLGVTIADFGVGDHVAHEPLAGILAAPRARGKVFAEVAANTGIQLSQALLVNFGPPTNAPEPEKRDIIDKNLPPLLEFLVEAGVSSLMVTAGPRHASLSWEECFQLAVDGLSRYARLSEGRGILVCLEPDVDSFLRNPTEALALLEAVSGIGLTLDLSHFICRSIAQSDVECLLPRTHLVHVRQASPGLIVDHWNTGTIDFTRLVHQLEAAHFNGEYCVEYLGVAPTLDRGIDPYEENARALESLREILNLERKTLHP